jgi:DNA-binding winged helix-turn-helix (wHTH) protein/TolB-like protein
VSIRCSIIVIVSGRIQFGLFEFDRVTGVLLREGRPIKLQPQPAKVLGLLTSKAGNLVTREELRQQVWADGTFVDFERGLNFCIAQIRTALGDSADSPRYVETIPKRGYRFIAPVRPLDFDTLPPKATASAVGGQWFSRRHLTALALGATGLTIVAILAATAGRDSRVRIAVLPFDNETGQQAFGDLAQGIADATVARLAAPERIGRLAVVGNSAALRRPRAFRDLKAIGQEAAVEYVVLAQVKRDESRVRLIAHLIRVSDEAHVWAQTFDRPAFTLEAQAEIAEAIAAAVSARLSPGG